MVWKLTRDRSSALLLYYSMIAIGIAGLLSPTRYNILPANSLLEAIFFACAILAFRVPKKSIIFFFVGSLLYVIGSFALMTLFKPADYLDFAQTYKAFIYIAPLCVFYKNDIFSRERTLSLLKVLLVFFAIKYLYSILLNFTPRMGTRPGIYVENNFELIFLILLFYVMRFDFGKSLNKWFALLLFVVIISGSRSSMLAMLVMFFGIYLTKISLKTFFYFLGMAILGLAAVAMFALRSKGGGVESIDRYKFMMVFVYEVSNWPLWKFFTGNFPITALSPESCKSLSSYHRLFSFSGDGTCYSVILHSYFLRAILDHGILGLLFLFGFIAFAMRKSKYSTMDVVIFLGIISTSALSVSAVNNVFVSLALALALGLMPLADQRAQQNPGMKLA